MILLFPARADADDPVAVDIDVLVLADGEPVAIAFVAVDLDGSGTWDEHLGEPHGHTDHTGLVVFSDLVSVGDPGHGDGGEDGPAGRHPTRIVIGNFSGTVGSNVVGLDFVLPAGSDQATLGLYDLRGRLLARVRGHGDLRLDVPARAPQGVYFARLSAGPAAPAALRFTSAGLRTRSIRAHRLSTDEAVAAGLIEAQTQKQPNNDGWEHPANIIVEHPEYAPAIKPVVLTPDLNSFVVNMAPSAGDILYPGGFDIACGYSLSALSMTTADTLLITRTVANQEAFSLTGLFFTENLPPEFTVVARHATIGGVDVPFAATGPVPGQIIQGHDSHGWIIDSRGDVAGIDRVLAPGETLRLELAIVCEIPGVYNLPHHATVFAGGGQGFFATSGAVAVEVGE